MNSNALSDKPVVTIIGLGLLGTSLAMALQKTNNFHIWGFARRNEIRQWAINKNIIQHTHDDVNNLIAQSDICVICLPIPAIIEFIQNHAPFFKKNSIVTDIGSVKNIIVQAGEKYLAPFQVNFIGSHPMAGTEKSGPDAAFDSLYDNAEVFVCPSPNSNLEALEKIKNLWQSINTAVVPISPQDHDVLVAHTSHISHLLALSITQAVLNCDNNSEKQLRFSGCATGFRDTSRIASSSPSMWREIIENNHQAVLQAMDSFESYWRKLRNIIESKDFDAFEREFADGKKRRDSWIQYKNQKHNCKW